jgi:hypothetical protein
MKKQPRQDRDVQRDGKADHPFENDESGVDPRNANFVIGKRSAALRALSSGAPAAMNAS